MLREIVFDTETTGIDHAAGDRVVEFGGIELVNHIPTGRHFHVYVNPGRPVDPAAFAVHGLSDEFLAGYPPFASVADELYGFIGEARLVAHNATFDLGFLNAEFTRTGHALLPGDRILDTLHLARRKHPGASNSLDALCARYAIDSSRRVKHGALLDSELLAEVYIELIGGRQTSLGLAQVHGIGRPAGGAIVVATARVPRESVGISAAERDAHAAFVASLPVPALWNHYIGEVRGAPPA